jgi:uncharacterized protein
LAVLSGPLVIDTRELGSKPGTERTLDLTVQAPSKMGYDVFAVPEGSEIAVEFRLDVLMEGICVSGSFSAQAEGECVRCLEPVSTRVDSDFQEMYLFEAPAEEDEGDEEDHVLEGDSIDLEPVLLDAVVLALPHNPLCDPECPGLCPECGFRLADDPDHTHGEAIDPRWASLIQLAEQPQSPADQSESGTSSDESKE